MLYSLQTRFPSVSKSHYCPVMSKLVIVAKRELINVTTVSLREMWVSEWLWLKHNAAMLQRFHAENSESVSNCSQTRTQQCFSSFIFNGIMMKSALYSINTLSSTFIVSPSIAMSSRSATLSCLRANQSLLFILFSCHPVFALHP